MSQAQALAEPREVASLSLEEGIATITIDLPDKKLNMLSSRLFEFFERAVGSLKAEKGLKAIVVGSGKPDNFIVGADIEELSGLGRPSGSLRPPAGGAPPAPPSTREGFLEMVQRAHKLLNAFEAIPVPKVCAIHGPCLGGGLELALTCSYRIASESKSTRLGFPEVKLGLIPGAGGTQRTPILVGLASALDLILTGKELDGRRARKIGLVDEVVHPADLAPRARAAAKELAAGTLKVDRPGRGLSALLLEKTPARRLAFNKARDGVLKLTGGHYPAPLKAIEVLERTATMTLEDGLEVEAKAFADLVVTDVAKNLMGLFFMKNEVDKKDHAKAKAMEVAKVGVLGAGLMGAGIGQVLAAKGLQIRFNDLDQARLGWGYKYCWDRFSELVDRRRMTPIEREIEMARVTGTTDYSGFSKAQVVIEAVFEDLEVKRKKLREVEAVTGPKAIFASNTSSLPITEIAKASARPERVIGMHFFSPVHKMPLVEVIRTQATDDETVATIVALGRKMGKTVIVVNDGVGFFTSRALGPYMNEAALCLEDGAAIDEIDAALTRFGFPVGPMTLLDEVGIDIAEKVGHILHDSFGDRFKGPESTKRLVDDGRKGRKNGKGLYLYDPDGKGGFKKRKEVDETVYRMLAWTHKPMAAADIADRCWLMLLTETVRCMEEGIITDPKDVDIGVIFGFGFPPFKGGILKTADDMGISNVVRRLGELEKKHGPRFAPPKMLIDLDKAGKKFHG